MAAKIESFFRGDTLKLFTTFTTTVDDVDIPVDCSGWEVWVTLKTLEDDADVDAVLQHSEILPNDADSILGLATITVPSSSTDAVTPGLYFYDIQRVVAGSPPDVFTLAKGKVRVKKDITRATT